MAWNDPALVGVLSALAGAAAGGVGAWLLERGRERRADARHASASLQEKLHQLEVRMAQVERDMVHALRLADLIRRRR